MTITQMVQNQLQQRISELAQRQQIKQIAFDHMKNGCGWWWCWPSMWVWRRFGDIGESGGIHNGENKI